MLEANENLSRLYGTEIAPLLFRWHPFRMRVLGFVTGGVASLATSYWLPSLRLEVLAIEYPYVKQLLPPSGE